MSLKMFLRADKKYKKTHNYLACRIKTKLTKLIIISPSYLETKMILAKVNKLSYIIMKHFKFLLQKSFVVLRDKANKYCCQFNAKSCNKHMFRETGCEDCEDCQPMNKVFYRNRCVICHFKLALYHIHERYEKIINEENLDKYQSILKI